MPFLSLAQSDTSTFRSYDKTFGISPETHRSVKWVKSNADIMVIVGDSLYNTLSNEQLESKIRNGDYEFTIVNNNDSIQKILMARIKSIMILKKRSVTKGSK